MKKCRWLIAVLSIVGLVATTNIQTVNAEKYTGQAIWPSEFIDNIYIKKVKSDGYIKYQQARFIRRSEDNKFLYCLQPFVEIDNNYVYNVSRSDYETATGLSKAQWDRVALLSYYGYGYEGHSDKKWYAITQVLIWRTTTPDADIFFTDSLNGNRINDKFSSEIAELESLVANHKKIPTFEEKDVIIPLGSTITLNDTNNVLSNYTVSSSSNITATKNGNSLSIKANGIGDASITFTKTDTKYETAPVVYFSPYSQDVMRVGSYDPITISFNLKVIGGKVTINKIDRDTGEAKVSGNAGATLGGAKFGIYYADTNELLATVTTQDDGTITSPILSKIGKMYIKELESSKGYLISNEKFYFEITESDLNPTVTVHEQIIRRNVEISKFYSQEETGILKPEPSIEFGFFNSSNELVSKIVTDSQGWGVASIPYGTYTVKQLNTLPNMEKAKDFTITITEQNADSLKYTIVNKELTAKLKIVKIDAETKKVIPLSGIKFKVLDSNNNEVCQTITYPTAQKVCEYETTKDGILYMPYNIKAGNYKILEIEDQIIDGYLWNNTPLEFSINENSNFIMDDELGNILEVKFSNERVKGQIDITKYGEKLVIDNDTFTYEKIILPDVSFDIFATEDIIIGGNKFYSKGDLVTTITSDSSGKASAMLELGSYCLVEKNSSLNNLVDVTPKCFDLEYKDQYTKIIYETMDLDNYLAKGKLEFTKTDLVTGEPIPDTLIEIYHDDGTENGTLIFSGKTDSSGRIVIDNLFTGKFFLIEKEPNSNYQITDEIVYFEILENNEVVKATMTNEKIIIEVPNTSANEFDYTYILAGILVLGGITFIVYEKKRKNKNK